MSQMRVGLIEESPLIPLVDRDVVFQAAVSVRSPESKNEAVDLGSLIRYANAYSNQMVLNGNGALGDNTNFPEMTFIEGVGPDGRNAFMRESLFYELRTPEKFPIDNTCDYDLSFFMRHEELPSGYVPKHFAFVSTYDTDLNTVVTHASLETGEAVLASDLNVGDNVIHLSDVSGFYDGDVSHRRSIRFKGYVNSHGYEYDKYSRWYSEAAWDEGAINLGDNTIQLNAPWSLAAPAHANGTWVAGTTVFNAIGGAAYNYLAMDNAPSQTTWTKYSGVLTAAAIRPGACFAGIGFFLNFNGTEVAKTFISNIRLERRAS